MSRIYVLKRTQLIPASLPEVWDYFSMPENLADITPPDMRFRVTSPPQEGPVYPGLIITYKVSPLAGIPLTWVTEITHVREGVYFVDEQRAGPYRMWHHQHHFKEVAGGIEMTDLVHYSLPLGWLGRLAHYLFVKRRLEQIFRFRFQVVTNHFTPVL
ncbi:SRPBCC family protein [Chitinophaga solisilvae]|uniref:SRPBCC family protein n=1 Tax=Chitinophaga solisilvae TaxID=1233460 RepID=A0A3S1CWZ7_9BACT|nr:SRPBCC family protein [Chitinophaga solisilvae]NSL89595.1 SRPBCC family protein [Chitinophaga solisilvae]